MRYYTNINKNIFTQTSCCILLDYFFLPRNNFLLLHYLLAYINAYICINGCTKANFDTG